MSTNESSNSSTTTEKPTDKDLTSPEVDISLYFIELVSIPLQAYLICIISAIDELQRRQNPFKDSVVNFCAQGIFIANLIFWLNGSFLSFEVLHDLKWNNEVFGEQVWAGLAQFILPLYLFFRFHSVHIILECFIDIWLPRSNSDRRPQDSMVDPSNIPYHSLK